MNTLSLFNGMSVCQMAMEDCGIEIGTHYISEIDKYANQATEALFGKPLTFIEWCEKFHSEDVDLDCGVINTGELEHLHGDTYDVDYLIPFLESKPIQLGDVTQWRDWDIDWSSIDLVTGGFPCQAWSMAGKQLGDKDERGMLFWTMLDIMKHVKHHNPKANFIIENVRMKKEFEEYITKHTENALGEVHKILINSALVSAQNRNRYYWTSFPVTQPADMQIAVNDAFIDGFLDGVFRPYVDYATSKNSDCLQVGEASDIRGMRSTKAVYSMSKKSPTLTTMGGGHREPKFAVSNTEYQKATSMGCMILQSIPINHINKLMNSGISNTQLKKMTGNAWTMKVISHILKCMEILK